MGQLLEGMPAVLIFAPLLLPIAVQFGINPVQYSMVLVMAMGIGSFAPPAGIGFYVAAATGRESVERSTWHFLPSALQQRRGRPAHASTLTHPPAPTLVGCRVRIQRGAASAVATLPEGMTDVARGDRA